MGVTGQGQSYRQHCSTEECNLSSVVSLAHGDVCIPADHDFLTTGHVIADLKTVHKKPPVGLVWHEVL